MNSNNKPPKKSTKKDLPKKEEVSTSLDPTPSKEEVTFPSTKTLIEDSKPVSKSPVITDSPKSVTVSKLMDFFNSNRGRLPKTISNRFTILVEQGQFDSAAQLIGYHE